MTWLDSFKETNKPIEYKKVWYDNKVYLLPCDPKLVKIVLRSDTEPEFIYEDDIIRGKGADCCVYDDCMYIRGSTYTQLKEILNSIKKENEDMPKIVDYKYNEEKGLTEITWDDKTITRVVAGDDTEKSVYVGFVSACAKKLFGNKSTYLNQFDKWTVKIPAKQKAEAEKKAAEDKLNAEAKAKRDAKKAKRKKQCEIEKLAKQIADEYYAQELTEEAEKLAVKKYGVPKSYLDEYDCDCCECKEFDVMDDETITD